ncbi:MAG: hypothetical protein JKX92_08285 [Porticoccaceae bacterium]|nr:hypothetical protein [Porticoccaceae bacterium]
MKYILVMLTLMPCMSFASERMPDCLSSEYGSYSHKYITMFTKAKEIAIEVNPELSQEITDWTNAQIYFVEMNELVVNYLTINNIELLDLSQGIAQMPKTYLRQDECGVDCKNIVHETMMENEEFKLRYPEYHRKMKMFSFYDGVDKEQKSRIKTAASSVFKYVKSENDLPLLIKRFNDKKSSCLLKEI